MTVRKPQSNSRLFKVNYITLHHRFFNSGINLKKTSRNPSPNPNPDPDLDPNLNLNP